MFRSYSSVEFGTKPGEKKHFKQKRFHPEGEATSRPVKTSARPFLSGRRTLGVLYCVKRKVWGRLYIPTYFFLSLHKKRKEVGAKDFNHVCEYLSGGVLRCHVRILIDGGGCMVKLCIACTVSYFFLSLHNRKCGAKDLLMYAYRTISYCIPVNFRKKGGSRIKGAVQRMYFSLPFTVCCALSCSIL